MLVTLQETKYKEAGKSLYTTACTTKPTVMGVVKIIRLVDISETRGTHATNGV